MIRQLNIEIKGRLKVVKKSHSKKSLNLIRNDNRPSDYDGFSKFLNNAVHYFSSYTGNSALA